MGKWWLVTWGTYASWLPGDPRGFKTWRGHRYIPPPEGKSHFGEPTYRAADYEFEHRVADEISGPAVALTPVERRLSLEAIVSDIDTLPMSPSILSVSGQHVHLLAKFGSLKIRPTVGRLKFAATQRLRRNGFKPVEAWAAGCHMESMPTEEAFQNAFQYVQNHELERAAIHVWRLEYADDTLPF